ncbi:hypothetical protein ACFX2I_046066 [Malus domestica]
MPSKNLEFKSPYQLLFGKVPEIHNFKVFRTAIYPLMRPYVVNKLQARSSQYVFLGYALGYKGAICYDLKNRRLILSRHVIHNEEVFPYKTELSQEFNSSKLSKRIKDDMVMVQMPTPATNSQVPISSSVSIQEL